MVNISINGKQFAVADGLTILEAAREAGIVIPTLCHLKGLNEVGACRVCVVEVKGSDRLVAACNTKVAEGMEVETSTARVLETRMNNLRLILSAHDCNCLTCERNGSCRLQLLAQQMGLMERQPYPVRVAADRWDASLPLLRRSARCISCLRCVNVCDKMQGLGVWDLLGLGSRAKVGVREGKSPAEANCTFCGQCVTHCPVSALNERDDTHKFRAAVLDPRKTVIVQVEPAVRAAWGDGLGLAPELATTGRMVAAFRRLGAKFVFDAGLAADLMVVENSHELVERLSSRRAASDAGRLTLFASCCPGWVQFLKAECPGLAPQLSSAKSPPLMFGAVAKSTFAEKIGKRPEDVVCVSVTPCMAMKRECERTGARDVDIVLTTREACRLVKAQGINAAGLREEAFDSPLGTSSGAGVITGAAGGLTEAVLRTASFLMEGKNPDPDAFRAVRGAGGRREAAVTIAGRLVRVCVASGLADARQALNDIRSGRAQYDFVEVMACPGGCVGGGGQPFFDGCELAEERGQALFGLDVANPIRFAHENPEASALYGGFLGRPLGTRARELLHVDWT